VKCDELANQLKERNIVIQTFRESYLRDVLSVKHNLNKITTLVDENETITKNNLDLHELQGIPSINLRPLIQRAVSIPQSTSLQLRECLLNAGSYFQMVGQKSSN
jgi:hypothetical protein